MTRANPLRQDPHGPQEIPQLHRRLHPVRVAGRDRRHRLRHRRRRPRRPRRRPATAAPSWPGSAAGRSPRTRPTTSSTRASSSCASGCPNVQIVEFLNEGALRGVGRPADRARGAAAVRRGPRPRGDPADDRRRDQHLARIPVRADRQQFRQRHLPAGAAGAGVSIEPGPRRISAGSCCSGSCWRRSRRASSCRAASPKPMPPCRWNSGAA